ncbi:hypothetical protein TRVA0_002S02454 [Trichomonascus vanleenenianus]|uniref:uncharacterized protein n=1 Tax=Trichomonascus vanleenenianus TaxID=2268995 RepID=UPI003ECA1B1C
MPEIGEVAHAAAILRRFLVGKLIKAVDTTVDDKVFASPLTNVLFERAFKGETVESVGRHGKYFWFRTSNSKVALLHFGMTGMVKVKGIATHLIVMENGGDQVVLERFKSEEAKEDMARGGYKEVKDEVWPPKYYKFVLKCDDDTQVAFYDPRRLGKIRYFEGIGSDEELMKKEPLSKLGIDFSKPDSRWDFETFCQKVTRRKLHVKTLLMDQAVFSGIGNWVADEVCYQARLHPQAMTNELTEHQLKALYDTIINICEFVVKVEGNTAQFPHDWLMLYRWGKRRKNDKTKTALGHSIKHITVGGRTSAFVPDLQKLTHETESDSQNDSDGDSQSDEDNKKSKYFKKARLPKKKSN